MAFVRVRDGSVEYDWPEEALMEGMEVVTKGYDKPVAANAPRPSKVIARRRTKVSTDNTDAASTSADSDSTTGASNTATSE